MKVVAKRGEIALDSGRAADQDMVGAGNAAHRQNLARKGAETPLHAVADYRIADFFGDGEAYPPGRVAVIAIADEQDKAGRGRAPSGVRSEEIRPLAKNN